MIGARALLLLAAAPALSGCVAAALPVIAASGVIGSQASRPAGEGDRGPPRVAIDMTPTPVTATPAGAEAREEPAPGARVKSYTLADGTRMEVMTGALPPPEAQAALSGAAPAPLYRPAVSPPAPTGPAAGAPSSARAVAAVAAPPGGARAPLAGFTSYDPFYSHALSQGSQPVAGSERQSALLVDPGTLAPKTRACSIHPPAVLIDLDPSAGMLDPAAATRADPRLVATLAALRAQEIAVGWISSVTADRAGALRRALVASGLDPAGRDELVLLRYPEERKQTRREDFGKTFCVVAIAGDERGDFDELFQYLKSPERGAALEALVGKGWFLIPQPLS